MAGREFSSGAVVIRRSGKLFFVLLIKDSYGRWTWPKGHIEKGESPKDAALREIEEEAGLKYVKILDEIGQVQYFYKQKNGGAIFKTVYLYLGESKTAKLTIEKKEIRDGQWYRPGDALHKIDYKGSRGLLKKAIERFAAIKGLANSKI